MACLSYIDGVIDAFEDDRRALKMPECLPTGGTGFQIRDGVMQWLAAHPKDRADTADSLIEGAIEEAWPACKS